MILFGLLLHVVVRHKELMELAARIYALTHIVQTVDSEGIEPVVLGQLSNHGAIVIGDSEFAGSVEGFMHVLVEEPKQILVLGSLERTLGIHPLSTLVGRIAEDISALARSVQNGVLVVPVQDRGVPQPVHDRKDSGYPRAHIPAVDSVSLPCRGEAVDMVLEECRRALDVLPRGSLDDFSVFLQVIQDIWSPQQQLTVQLEELFRVDGHIEPADEVGQRFALLDNSERVHQVAVEVVEDLDLGRGLEEEKLCAAHARLDIGIVRGRNGEELPLDALLVPDVR